MELKLKMSAATDIPERKTLSFRTLHSPDWHFADPIDDFFLAASNSPNIELISIVTRVIQ